MKKLNNKGWGLGVFITFLGLFFLAILVVVVLSSSFKFGEDSNPNIVVVPPSENNSDNNSDITHNDGEKYANYEAEIKIAAEAYKNEKYPSIENGDVFYVNINKLTLSKNVTNDCSGYAKIGKVHENDYYEAYIRCSLYTTPGYEESLE